MEATLVNLEYLNETVDEFIENLVTKGKALNTWQSYKRDLAKFVEYLKELELDEWSSTTTEMINDFADDLLRKGCAPSSVTRSLASIKALYRYLENEGFVVGNLTKNIKSIKIEKKAPRGLTSAEVNLLLEQPDMDTSKGLRDRAMLELLYATGMKVSELIGLNVEDIEFDTGFISCKSQKHTREIPIYPSAKKILESYIKTSRENMIKDITDVALFVNCNGTRITRQGFWKLIKYYQEQANIKNDITPQVLRHSFAMHLLENGAGLPELKELLGHVDISSTKAYLEAVKDRLRGVYINAHPRADVN